MRELGSSVIDTIRERVTSPLAGTLVVSWSLVNYKFFLVIFSGDTISTKLYQIDTLVFPGEMDAVIRGIVIPISISLFYIFIYPYIARPIYRFTRWQQKLMQDIRDQIDAEKLITREEYRKLRSQIIDIQNEYDMKLGAKDTEIEALKNEVNHLQKALENNNKTESEIQGDESIKTNLREDKQEDENHEKLMDVLPGNNFNHPDDFTRGDLYDYKYEPSDDSLIIESLKRPQALIIIFLSDTDKNSPLPVNELRRFVLESDNGVGISLGEFSYSLDKLESMGLISYSESETGTKGVYLDNRGRELYFENKVRVERKSEIEPPF